MCLHFSYISKVTNVIAFAKTSVIIYISPLVYSSFIDRTRLVIDVIQTKKKKLSQAISCNNLFMRLIV